MVGTMAKIDRAEHNDELVEKARTEAEALGRLYELYYERIFRLCVHRLFNKQAAEDVTSTVFLDVARKIRTFSGRGEDDFRGVWLKSRHRRQPGPGEESDAARDVDEYDQFLLDVVGVAPR